MGMPQDCRRNHFYESFINYRFFYSFRNALFDADKWNDYKNELSRNFLLEMRTKENTKMRILQSIKLWNPK